MPRSLRRRAAFAGIIGSIGGIALALQLSLSIDHAIAHGRGAVAGLVTFLGYFTILSNLLAAVALAAGACRSRSRSAEWFRRTGVITAIAASMIMVSATYHLIMRQLWHLEGLQLAVDSTLHYVMPAFFLAYWWLAVRDDPPAWRAIPYWLLYPVGYLVYVLARGVLIGRYPYPFVDVELIGYGWTLINAGGLMLAFMLVSALLVATAKGAGSVRVVRTGAFIPGAGVTK